MTTTRFAWREVAVVASVQALLLLAMAPSYGPHRDELYFASAGQRLAWGYPDQPALVPLLARWAAEISPHSLVVLRLPSIIAVAALVVLAAWFARLLGGRRRAQTLAAVVTAFSVFPMAVGHRLSTATFDTLAWTAILVLVAQSLAQHRPRLWLAAGLVAGVGLNTKNSVAFLLLAVVLAVALDPLARPVLRTRWPWLGGTLALTLWLPHLLRQAQHDWPALALSADIARDYGGPGGRLALVGQALVMYSPLVAVVWIAGLVQLLRRPGWVALRPVATVFVVVALGFLVIGGKGYYLAGAIPPLIAAGCVVLAESCGVRRTIAAGSVLVLSAMVAWPAFVPVLPVRTYTASFYPSIDGDQPETIGWPEYAATVRSVVDDLSVADRRTAVVLASNYGEAGAMEWYDVGLPVYSGHNAWQDWGPPPDGAGPVLVVGEDPGARFEDCERRATLHHQAGVDNEEEGQGVWWCAGPSGSWAEVWSSLSFYAA